MTREDKQSSDSFSGYFARRFRSDFPPGASVLKKQSVSTRHSVFISLVSLAVHGLAAVVLLPSVSKANPICVGNEVRKGREGAELLCVVRMQKELVYGRGQDGSGLKDGKHVREGGAELHRSRSEPSDSFLTCGQAMNHDADANCASDRDEGQSEWHEVVLTLYALFACPAICWVAGCYRTTGRDGHKKPNV